MSGLFGRARRAGGSCGRAGRREPAAARTGPEPLAAGQRPRHLVRPPGAGRRNRKTAPKSRPGPSLTDARGADRPARFSTTVSGSYRGCRRGAWRQVTRTPAVFRRTQCCPRHSPLPARWTRRFPPSSSLGSLVALGSLSLLSPKKRRAGGGLWLGASVLPATRPPARLDPPSIPGQPAPRSRRRLCRGPRFGPVSATAPARSHDQLPASRAGRSSEFGRRPCSAVARPARLAPRATGAHGASKPAHPS